MLLIKCKSTQLIGHVTEILFKSKIPHKEEKKITSNTKIQATDPLVSLWFGMWDFTCIIIHWTHYLFFDWPEAYSVWLARSIQWIFEISACDVITADYTTIMSRILKVTGNHVMYGRCSWLFQVRSLCLACHQWQSKNMTFFVSFNV